LIDLCNPTETLTVAEYQQQAQGMIQGGEGDGGMGDGGWGDGGWGDGEILSSQPSALSSQPRFKTQNSKLKTLLDIPYPLLVGGTGLYIKSIVKGMKIPRVSPQMELRSQLQSLGQSQCYGMLQQVDPTSAAKIHPNDQVRTLRSLEVFYVTGRPMSEQQGEDPPTYPILQIGLDCAHPDALQRRIELRTGQMVEAGLVAEVAALCQKYGTELPLLNTLGYAEFKQYLAGKISLVEAINLTVLHTRQFAKRQRTWFRADSAIEWFDADHPHLLEQVWQRVQNFIQLN
jgi:tRNA dimethylallyltransferase